MATYGALTEKYGKTRDRQSAINRAIRTEIQGGSDCLDAMEKLHMLVRRLKGSGFPAVDQAQIALDACRAVANRMSETIELRYGTGPVKGA